MLFNESTDFVETDLLATASQHDDHQAEPEELENEEEADSADDDAEPADDREEVSEDETNN